jgi:hypothetical protein
VRRRDLSCTAACRYSLTDSLRCTTWCVLLWPVLPRLTKFGWPLGTCSTQAGPHTHHANGGLPGALVTEEAQENPQDLAVRVVLHMRIGCAWTVGVHGTMPACLPPRVGLTPQHASPGHTASDLAGKPLLLQSSEWAGAACCLMWAPHLPTAANGHGCACWQVHGNRGATRRAEGHLVLPRV